MKEDLTERRGFLDGSRGLKPEVNKTQPIGFSLDGRGHIRSFSNATTEYLRYGIRELVGQHFSVLFSDEHVPENFPDFILSQASKMGKFKYEGWIRNHHDTLFWTEMTIVPEYDEIKKTDGFLVSLVDGAHHTERTTLLKESEDRYNHLLKSISDAAVMTLDIEGKVYAWNSGAEQLYGYKEKQIVGKHVSAFYSSQAIEAGYPEFELKKTVAEGQYTGEVWRLRKDGTSFYAQVSISPLFDFGKRLIGFSKITKDLTDKRQTAQLMKEKEDRFRLLIENISDYAIYVLDKTGRIVTWNKGATNLKGYSESEIIGAHFSIFYTRQNGEESLPERELELALKNGKCEGEGWRIRKDGVLFWASYVMAPLYDVNNEFVGFYKITRDLSERKRSEKELLESEERYKLLVNSVRDYAIFIMDSKGYITTWNSGAENLKGYKAEEIIGKHFSIFYSDEAIKSGHPDYELRMAIKEGKYEEEGWRIKKDGSLFWVNIIISPMYNSDNRLIGFSKITRDLTARKKVEDQLKTTITDLDNFIYTASHDLKSPITNLEGLVNVLHQEVSPYNEKAYKLINLISLSINKFKETISDLTEISRIQRVFEEDIEPLYFQEFIDEFKLTHSLLINENKAVISADIQVETLHFSRKNLRSIVNNLLSNAIKYRHPSRRPRIIISTRYEAGYIVLSVKDNGLGIKNHDIPKVFGMFKRLHDHVSGSGIGLYIVKRIVENAGGKVEVESIYEEGSDFKVLLKGN